LNSPSGDRGERDLRSFGRKRGRKLSARQQQLIAGALPRLRLPLDQPPPERLATIFGEASKTETWLEIGFGGAEHLVWQAEHHPEVGLIGCEPFEEGVVKALTAIEEKGLGNVRLHPDDARDVLRWLPKASISRAFILFPDPWPKRKHVKRRLVSPTTLVLLARVMRPGSELRIATDIGDYARTTLLAISSSSAFRWPAKCPADWRDRPPDWPPTRYEAKAKREGRRCYYFTFLRVQGPNQGW
jgi:tRNA (guanine-N7-)-methyltransferase